MAGGRKKSIRVGIADDHSLFLKGMATMLNRMSGIKVVVEATDGKDLLKQMGAKPEVILMDLKMPEMDGFEATVQVKKLYPEVKILALTMYDNVRFVTKIIENGAGGYLLKNASATELEDAIFSVYETGYYFNDQVSRAMLFKLMNSGQINPVYGNGIVFQKMELQILTLICREHNSVEIADRVNLSPRTVEGYRKILYKKTKARNTAGLVIFAIKNGILDLEF